MTANIVVQIFYLTLSKTRGRRFSAPFDTPNTHKIPLTTKTDVIN